MSRAKLLLHREAVRAGGSSGPIRVKVPRRNTRCQPEPGEPGRQPRKGAASYVSEHALSSLMLPCSVCGECPLGTRHAGKTNTRSNIATTGCMSDAGEPTWRAPLPPPSPPALPPPLPDLKALEQKRKREGAPARPGAVRLQEEGPALPPRPWTTPPWIFSSTSAPNEAGLW